MRRLGLSYKTAPMANQFIDTLPSGPKWSSKRLVFRGFETDEPIVLYMRDAAECVEYLLNNPMFADRMNFVPVKHFTADGKRVFSEPVSATQAWETQVSSFKFVSILYSIEDVSSLGCSAPRCNTNRRVFSI
jgi:hypothetical protein